ncbi:RDD family protein [uncultured Draconibacterium sp.]|uniref:RDD family protein n=1 Tax=uncultured Draconibacterium sp. TaxID=1573823 RepID=UPI0025E1BC07|nr:RDD family protein [uncultured Draconibacterium sp.]
MTREERLKFCKICENKQMSLQEGLICNISGKAADFEESCPHFREDPQAKQEIAARDKFNALERGSAGTGKRFANYIIDWIFIYIFILVLFFTLGVALEIAAPGIVDSIIGNTFLLYFWILLNYYMYFVILEATTGRTIAKFITGTKVVTMDGEQPNFSTILLRSICRFIPFEAFSFLFESQRGWHDRLSKTRVIVVKKEKKK